LKYDVYQLYMAEDLSKMTRMQNICHNHNNH